MNPDNLEVDLLEIKAFNRLGSPGFDIADFRMYEEEIISKPYMLDVDYLIFGYDVSDEGVDLEIPRWSDISNIYMPTEG